MLRRRAHDPGRRPHTSAHVAWLRGLSTWAWPWFRRDGATPRVDVGVLPLHTYTKFGTDTQNPASFQHPGRIPDVLGSMPTLAIVDAELEAPINARCDLKCSSQHIPRDCADRLFCNYSCDVSFENTCMLNR